METPRVSRDTENESMCLFACVKRPSGMLGSVARVWKQIIDGLLILIIMWELFKRTHSSRCGRLCRIGSRQLNNNNKIMIKLCYVKRKLSTKAKTTSVKIRHSKFNANEDIFNFMFEHMVETEKDNQSFKIKC